jgi:peptidyl-prolyl cis-trans isomerase C
MIDPEKESVPRDPEPRIRVNGVAVTESAIAAEMQHHPAATGVEAYEEAVRALVIRQVLLQEAKRQALSPAPQEDSLGRKESPDEAAIRELLAQEVKVPRADEAACRRFYENNRSAFISPELFEAAHILYAADPQDADAVSNATKRAEYTIERLRERPERFAEIARTDSDCSSGSEGGALGQLARGQSVTEFETALDDLEEGGISAQPVITRFGAHVVRLDRRVAACELPFETVQERIAAYLDEQVWRRAVQQYLQLLLGSADIEGVDLGGAESPLVQ